MVQTKQQIVIRNGDPFGHNVHVLTTSSGNLERNLALMPEKELLLSFPRPEMNLRLTCDIHGWEFGCVHVIEHRYFAVTGRDGVFSLTNVPPGKYTVEASHRKAGSTVRDVTIRAGEKVDLEFVLDVPAPESRPGSQPMARPAVHK